MCVRPLFDYIITSLTITMTKTIFGAAIVARENTRKHLSADTRVEAWDFTLPAAPSAYYSLTTTQPEKRLTKPESDLLSSAGLHAVVYEDLPTSISYFSMPRCLQDS